MSRGTPTTPFRIPTDLKAKVKAEAERRGESMTDVVIRAFEAYLAASVVTPVAFMPPPADQR